MSIFLQTLATMRRKRKLEVVARKLKRKILLTASQKTRSFLESAEASEKCEGRVFKNLSRDFMGSESRILVALSRNTDVDNQEPAGNRSENDPYSEV